MASPSGLTIRVYDAEGYHLFDCDNLTQARSRANELFGHDFTDFQASIVFIDGHEGPVYYLRVDPTD